MSYIGKLLNIKQHMVNGVPITGPFDIEVHKGYDNKFYAVCTRSILDYACDRSDGSNFVLGRWTLQGCFLLHLHHQGTNQKTSFTKQQYAD